MTHRHLLWLLPLLLTQHGCALLTTNYSENQSQIEQWVEQQQYGRALRALGNVDPKDPHYLEAANKRKQVEVLAASYEHEIRQQNSRRLEEGNWEAALDSYDDALDRLPESVVLKDGLAQLHREQAEELERLELKRLSDRGNWLKKTIPTYRDIARVDPRNRTAQYRLEKIQQEAEGVADQLALHGNRALANNELDKSEELLSLASELSSAPAIEESLKKLKQKREYADKEAQTAREKHHRQQYAAEQRRQRTIENLLDKFDRAFKNKKYPEARQHLAALAKADLESSQYRSLQKKLNRAIDREATRLFEAGVNAYSRGYYAKAASYWREVLTLQPENKQAKENLERAERVLEKLEQLKEKQHKN